MVEAIHGEIRPHGISGTNWRAIYDLCFRAFRGYIDGEDGRKQVFKLEANGFKRLALKPFTAYRVESTGNIMVYSGWVTPRTYFIPAAEGGFFGIIILASIAAGFLYTK